MVRIFIKNCCPLDTVHILQIFVVKRNNYTFLRHKLLVLCGEDRLFVQRTSQVFIYPFGVGRSNNLLFIHSNGCKSNNLYTGSILTVINKPVWSFRAILPSTQLDIKATWVQLKTKRNLSLKYLKTNCA